MPLNLIPQKLHFLWLGSPFPVQHADNLIEWATLNVRYEVHLWVERKYWQEAVDSLKQGFDRIFPSFGEDFYVEEKHKEFRKELFVSEHSGGVIVYFNSDALPTFSIWIDYVETLSPITHINALEGRISYTDCLSLALEVMRFWIIYTVGGIYLDVRFKHGGIPLNDAIIAPLGLLTYEVQTVQGGMLSSCVLASNKENNHLRTWLDKRQSEVILAAFHAVDRARYAYSTEEGVYFEMLWSIDEIYQIVTERTLYPPEPRLRTPDHFDRDNDEESDDAPVAVDFDSLLAAYEQIRERLAQMPAVETIETVEIVPSGPSAEEIEHERYTKVLAEGAITLLSFSAQSQSNVRLKNGVELLPMNYTSL